MNDLKNSQTHNVSQTDLGLLENIRSIALIGLLVLVFGIGGIVLGTYSLYFRAMSPDSRPLIRILILYSIGQVVYGWLCYRMAKLLAKAKRNL